MVDEVFYAALARSCRIVVGGELKLALMEEVGEAKSLTEPHNPDIPSPTPIPIEVLTGNAPVQRLALPDKATSRARRLTRNWSSSFK